LEEKKEKERRKRDIVVVTVLVNHSIYFGFQSLRAVPTADIPLILTPANYIGWDTELIDWLILWPKL
jgi:hypothetical protein